MPKTYSDITRLPLFHYISQPYDGMKAFVDSGIIAKDVRMRISVPYYGKTPIFRCDNFDYYSGEYWQLVSRLSLWKERLPDCRQHSHSCRFEGIISVLPGKMNDGMPESYFLDFVLLKQGKHTKKVTYIKIPGRKTSKDDKHTRSVEQKINRLYQRMRFYILN